MLPRSLPGLFARSRHALLALSALLTLSGCSVFRMDGHQSTMVVDGPVAKSQLSLFYVTFWVTLAIFIVVGAVLAYAMIKFRARSEADEHAEPPAQSHGNPLVEVGLIGLSVLALVIIAVPTLKGIWYTYDVPEDRKAEQYEVNAYGYQWWFKFEYPTEQIEGGGNLLTGNELVIPVGRPVRINLRTADVIHSFWVPKLAGKVDMIPNRGNHLWLEAETPGYYWGQCAEYCGDSHAVMRFRVIALSQPDFAAWVANQKAPARTVTAAAGVTPAAAPAVAAAPAFERNQMGFTSRWDPGAATSPLDLWKQQQTPSPAENQALIARGRTLFAEKACAGCHVVRGHEGAAPLGPDLTHFGSRTTVAAGLLENNPEQLARWITQSLEVKPGNKMGLTLQGVPISSDEAAALVAYLHSLK